MSIESLIALFFAAFLINNIILMRFLGLCSFFGVSDSIGPSVGMGLAVTFVLMLSTSVTWVMYHLVLVPLQLEFLSTLTFILVIATLVQLVELFMKKKMPGLYKALGIYLPLITTNCLILGVALLNVSYKYNIVQALVYSLGVAGGYFLAIMLFAGIRMRLRNAPIPKFIQGYPLVFFTAALMSLAFMGFTGLFGIH